MRTILVVDDEPKIVQLARDYLEHAGFAVVTAHDGKAALASARGQRPDLVVLDLGLPELDGLDVARTLRAESNVPIVMLTGRSEESDKLVGLELGADDYVTKPFSPRELVARVRASGLGDRGAAVGAGPPPRGAAGGEGGGGRPPPGPPAAGAGEGAVPAAARVGRRRTVADARRFRPPHGHVLRRRGLPLGRRRHLPLLDPRERARFSRSIRGRRARPRASARAPSYRLRGALTAPARRAGR